VERLGPPRRRWPAVCLALCMTALSACTVQQAADVILAPPSGTPSSPSVALPFTPLPTATPLVIQPRPLGVNVARLSVKPGEQQEVAVTGTPQEFINVIVSYATGDFHDAATVLGAQLDLNGNYVDKWTVDQLAPGGAVAVVVQDVQTGQLDRESFLIDAKPWGGSAPAGSAPLVAMVPYGTPGTPAVVMVTPQAGTPTPVPLLLPTPSVSGQEANGPLQVRAYPSPDTIAPGGTVRVNGVLADAAGNGVGGARLFAIGHFPSGHSEVWVSPVESGSNGLVWVSAPISGVTAGSTVLIDVYMTSNGQSYHGQTSVQVG